MTTTGISQKEYLKKYLSSRKDDKKKKKKKLKTNPAVNRMKIVDDDIDISSMKPLEDDELELDLYELQEDAPQIAGIIDERPEEVKNKEKFAPKKWRVVADENDTGVKVIDKSYSNITSSVKERSPDEDLLLVRNVKVKVEKESPDRSKEHTAIQSQRDKPIDSDESPPRKSRISDVECYKHMYNSDESPSRRSKSKDSESVQSNKNNHRHNFDDPSPGKTKRNSENIRITKSSYKHDLDEFPPRRSRNHDSDVLSPRMTRKHDSDESPPRRSRKHDSDESPPRRSKKPNSEGLPPRRFKKHDNDNDNIQSNKSKLKDGSDESPPRRNQERNKYLSPGNRQKYDSDESPPRKSKRSSPGHSQFYRKEQKYDSDESPPRRVKKDADLCLSRGSQHRSDMKQDQGRDAFVSIPGHRDSPQRSREKIKPVSVSQNNDDSDELPLRKNKKRSLTPPNKNRRRDSNSPQQKREKRKTSRTSPFKKSKCLNVGDSLRKTSKWIDEDTWYNRGESSKYGSPPGHFQEPGSSRRDYDHCDKRKDGRGSSSQRRQEYDKSPEATKEASRNSKKVTMDGRKAGLVGAGELKAEIADLRLREKQVFETMDPSVSGKGAAAVMRDRKTGKKRDLEEEARVQKEKDEKQAERDTKYMQWGKGLKQVSEQEQKVKEALYEMSKPLARYADDEDLDKFLREQEREGDPMLAYIKSKSKDKEEKAKLQYEGSYMPNRFGIRPGHRWDGVDRSNGYEKQWFEAQNSRKAVEEEAYKWSTSDM